MFRSLIFFYSFLIIPTLFGQRGQISFDTEFGEPSTKEEFLDVANFANEPSNQLILGNKIVAEQGRNFIWLLKIDQHGEQLWSLNLHTEQELFALHLAALTDGFVILAGDYADEQPVYRFTGKLHLLKINFAGEIQWEKQIEAPSSSEFLAVDEAKERISVYYKEGHPHRINYGITYDTDGNTLTDYEFSASNDRRIKEFVMSSQNEHLIGFDEENWDSYILEKRSPTGELLWATDHLSPHATNRKIASLFYQDENIMVAGYNFPDDFRFLATYTENGEFLNEIILEGEAAEHFTTADIFPNEDGYLSFSREYDGFKIVQIDHDGNFLWKRDGYSFPASIRGFKTIRYDGNEVWVFATTGIQEEKESDGWLMKIDADWKEVTTKIFGTPGPFHEESIFKIATTSDCGFMTLGAAFSIKQTVLFIQKWNYAGDLQWTHELPFQREAQPIDLQPLDDDHIQLTYARRSQYSDTMGIVKQIFNINTWESETQIFDLFESEYTHLTDFQYTSDGGAIALLRTRGLLKFSPSGARQWKTESFPSVLAQTFEEWDDGFYVASSSTVHKIDKFTGATEEFFSVADLFSFPIIGNMIKLPEGGYLLGIRINGNSKVVLKLDDDLQEDWRYIFTGIDFEVSSNLIFVEYGNERQYWIHHHRGIPKLDKSGQSESGLLILNQFGFIFWDKADWNGENMDILDWTRDHDGGFIFVGNVFKAHSNDYKIIKTDGVGNLTNQAAYDFPEFRVFPNPVADELNLFFETVPTEDVQLTFYNYLGQQLAEKEIEVCGDVRQYKTAVSDLPSGALILEVQMEEERQTKVIYKE